MFEHDAQLRQPAAQRIEGFLDKHRFAVENIDVGVGRLAVDEEWHPDFRHALQHRHHPPKIGDAVRRVGRRMRRVELDRGEDALAIAARDLNRIAAVGQVGGHQRCEIYPRWQSSHDPLAIGEGRRDRRHRRHQVRHHDCPRELSRGMRQHRGHHRAVAQMHVPVIGTRDCDLIGGFHHRSHLPYRDIAGAIRSLRRRSAVGLFQSSRSPDRMCWWSGSATDRRRGRRR